MRTNGLGRFQVPLPVMAVMLVLAGRLSADAPSGPSVRCNPATSPNGCVSLSIVLHNSVDGSVVTSGFRWLVQRDMTFLQDVTTIGNPAKPHVTTPGSFTPMPGDTLSVSLHASNAPTIAAGDTTDLTTDQLPFPLDPGPAANPYRYYVSVLPYPSNAPCVALPQCAAGTQPNCNYNQSGAPVVIAHGAATANVSVTQQPTPSAQMSVLIFEDKHPINGEDELPEERGLAGFTVQLLDTAGTLGISGGLISNDAYGHPFGTQYQLNPDGTTYVDPCSLAPVALTDASGNFVVQPYVTDSTGTAIIKNLLPGKWEVFATPPAMPPGQEWIQTTTLEGQPTIEGFVKPNEPPVFVEFGPPGYHVFIGYVQAFNSIPPPPAGGSTVTLTGRITNNHTSRPPEYTFYSGLPITGAFVGLNDLSGGPAGEGLYAGQSDPTTGVFTIPNVPVGSKYQLVVWDNKLDNVFAFYDASVPTGASGTYDLGDVPVFSWFSKVQADVFYDVNGNGVRDPGEPGIPGMTMNLRFRDGSIYDQLITNDSGHIFFQEVFPFFNYLVAEVDNSRMKPTGVTVHVDAGGPIDPNNPDSMGGVLNPQPQSTVTNTVTGNNLSRVQTANSDGSLVLTQAFQGFLGQTNYFQWGKQLWPAGQAGGIYGNVVYDSTREFDDPRIDVEEFWDPGVPRAQVNLYLEDPRATYDPTLVPPGPNPLYHGKIATANASGVPSLADVDNWPFGWSTGGPMGPEDVKRNGASQAEIDACNANRNCAFSLGDALHKTTSSSWDDRQPTGCQGPIFYVNNNPAMPTDCYDGLRNFNQVREGTYDGAYSFGPLAGGAPLTPGNYIVETAAPNGMVHSHEESKNIGFGQSITPSPQNLPAECVGDLHMVGSFLELVPNAIPVQPPYANTMRPYCDRKLVTVAAGQNTTTNFFLYTRVPSASYIVGITTDDTTNEFDPFAPNFGEKYAPPNMPVSIQDWTGREIGRTYTDQFGAYNALVPSSYSANIPVPSGYNPNMLVVCMNHPGPILDTNPASPTYNQMITDPGFLRQYSQFCYTLPFMPGKTSYLDTPVVPVAAFTGPGQSQLDCELPDGTPKIYSVSGPAGGPWVPTTGSTVTIVSAGSAVPVINPQFDTSNPTLFPRTINRDYGFGSVRGTVTVNGSAQPIVAWTPGSITVRINSIAGTIGQLMVTRGDNHRTTITGVTMTVARVGDPSPKSVPPGGSIQAVIDVANPGDLILVPPGNYSELLKMWKPVRLQGWGEGSTIVDASKNVSASIQNWRNWAQAFTTANPSYVLPGQPTGAGLPEPTLFATEEGPGLIVLGPGPAVLANGNLSSGVAKPANFFQLLNGYPNARVDGFTFTGGDSAGAIFINGYAHHLQISNNHIVANSGFYGGGIRSGYPTLTATVGAVDQYVDANNDRMTIAYNQITENGGLAGAGGGVSLCTGSTSYDVTHNWVCGNFTNGTGGGIGHLGVSNNGVIEHNTVIFNQTFDQSTTPGGGGIYVGGEAAVAAAAGPSISPGTGNVVINGNLVQGNLAGAGDGGGIRAEYVNGADVVTNPGRPGQWYDLQIYNNIVVDNMTGLGGGGISLQDVAKVQIINNTIANNDSVATSGAAFPANNQNTSNPIPGVGVLAYAHTAPLAAAFAAAGVPGGQRAQFGYFSNPSPFANNIVYQNRMFYFTIDPLVVAPGVPFHLVPDIGGAAAGAVFSDVALLGALPNPCPGTAAPCRLHPTYSLLTNATGTAADHNVTSAPGFLASYFDSGKGAFTPNPSVDTTDVKMAPAFDEGGNFIDVRYGPLTLYNSAVTPNVSFGNYSIPSASPATNVGSFPALDTNDALLGHDFFGNPRPSTAFPVLPDIGAVEAR